MAILTIDIFPGYVKTIVIPQSAISDSWDVTPGYLSHTLNIKSTVHKRFPSLKLNTVYRVRYEVYDYINCSVNLKVGTKEGHIQSSNGFVEEDFTIENDGDRTFTFVSDGILKIRNITMQEKVFITENIPFTNKDMFENKSWTISYSFYQGGSWVGYHSYIPLYYIHNQNHLYSFEGGVNIWKHNSEGLYQNYYGIKYPFIVEYVRLKDLQTRMTEDMTFITKARKWNAIIEEYEDQRFVTFNKLIAYNDRASTGEQQLIVRDDMADMTNWLFTQITNSPGQVLITRKERNWNLNEIRNYVIDPQLPLFSTSWTQLKDIYYIDKVVNQSNIDFAIAWSDVEMLRDKFLVVRLIFDTFDDVNLIFNYSLETEQISHH